MLRAMQVKSNGDLLLARGRADGALMQRLRLRAIRAAFAGDASRELLPSRPSLQREQTVCCLDAFGHAEDEQRGLPLPERGCADGALMHRLRVHPSCVASERAASLELLTSQPLLQRARTRCSLDAKGHAGDEQRGPPLLARDRADGALMRRLRLRCITVAVDREDSRELLPSKPSPQQEKITCSLVTKCHAGEEQRGPPLLARGRADGALTHRLKVPSL